MSISIDHNSGREFTLAAIRVALLRMRLIEYELEAVGVALKGNFISPETALEWAEDVAPSYAGF
jgi:hypothetical protein